MITDYILNSPFLLFGTAVQTSFSKDTEYQNTSSDKWDTLFKYKMKTLAALFHLKCSQPSLELAWVYFPFYNIHF